MEKTKKPGKQRKTLLENPYHLRAKAISGHLSSELKSSYGTRAIPVRTGDTVRIMRGDRTGFEGKISRVDRRNYRIFVEGVNREKADGTSIPSPIHASKVELLRLNLDDKRRKEALSRKGGVAEEKIEEKPKEKPKRKTTPKRKKVAAEKPKKKEASVEEGG